MRLVASVRKPALDSLISWVGSLLIITSAGCHLSLALFAVVHKA